jgi:hypothetical protein
VVAEVEPNNTVAQATPLAIPGVACGAIDREDVDSFKFQAAAGQTITFEVFCARLQDRIHDLQNHADPLVTLLDAAGHELAANDDYYFSDPLLSYTFSKAGEYTIQVRDSKYEGDRRWVYALLATDGPYVAHHFPLATNPSQKVEMEPVGSARIRQAKIPFTAPADPGIHNVALELEGGLKTNPSALIVTPLPLVLEQEPNDAPAHAQKIAIPCGINGRINQKRDMDCFAFSAKKGQVFRFEVFARRHGTLLQSNLDAILEIVDPNGNRIGNFVNDDAVGKDSILAFPAPHDGEFVVRIRDLNSKGGDGFVYFLQCDFARQDFTLRCDPDKAMIGPGSSTAWYVALERQHGFTGPVAVEVKGLPKGVTASPLTIQPAMTQGLIVLTAASDAAKDAVHVEIVGTATVKTPEGQDQVITRKSTPLQEIYIPGGGRDRFDVHLQSVAVTDPSDILSVDVSPKEITLRPGQEVKLDVAIQRRPGFDANVTLDVYLHHQNRAHGNPLPNGVQVDPGKSKTGLGKSNQGHVVLRADANAAPIENVPISVNAFVSINFVVKVGYSSPPIPLTIQK